MHNSETDIKRLMCGVPLSRFLAVALGTMLLYAQCVSSQEDSSETEQEITFTAEELEIRTMERLALALPKLHEAKTDGNWKFKDAISKFEITFGSTEDAWRGEIGDRNSQVEKSDLLGDTVEALRSVIREKDAVPFDVTLQMATVGIERHAIDVKGALDHWKLVNDRVVEDLNEFIPHATQNYLDCTQDAKSRVLKKSLDTRDHFLKSLLEALEGEDSSRDLIETVLTPSKNLLSSLLDHEKAFGDDSLLCMKDLERFYPEGAENQGD